MSTINAINNLYPAFGTPPYALSGPITLSQTDLQNLNTTPKLLVAALGSGYAILPIEYIEESLAGTAYSGGGSYVLVNASGTTLATSVPLVLNGTAVLSSASVLIASTTASYANLNNTGIYLKNTGTALTGGTQTAKVWLRYIIKKLV